MTNQETTNKNKIVNTHISQVTVYTDRARIIRHGEVTLTGSEQELVITGLPMTIDTDSVRIAGVDKVALRLLGVRTEQVFAPESTPEQITKLTHQIQDLEAQKRQIKDQLEALKMQLCFVKDLSKRSVDEFSTSVAKKEIGLNETTEFLNFLGQHYGEYTRAIANLENQYKDIDKQLNIDHRHLKQLQNHQNHRPQESWKLIITVAVAEPGNFQLEISYLVSQVSWNPVYDIGAISQSDRINITYLAEIKQTTGEDWQNVALTLSTAKPELGTLPPKFEPWYIDVLPQQPYHPRVVAMAAPAAMNYSEDDESESEISSQEAVEFDNDKNLIAAQTAIGKVFREGGFVTFKLDVNMNIPSDGTPHQVIVLKDDYPCRIEYIAIPKLISFVYQQATVTNPTTGATLLPGKVNIFRDHVFIGTTQLENISPGQEFTVNLGMNEGFSIDRQLVERQVDRKLIGNQQRTTYAYRLSITSLNEIETTLILKEQLPISRDERVKIQLTQTYPKIKAGKMGLLEWELTLKLQSNQEFYVYYQFVLEHPPDLTVVGLDI